jgi:O-antigen chain-terminating methyltransferase
MSDKSSAERTHEEELELAIREIRERVVARYPSGLWSGIELPDFTPVLEARDQAAAKVASIGRVNPRPGGPVNAVIQGVKRLIARGLGWFVRDQVEFNHATVRSLDAVLEGLNALNRTLKTLPPRFEPPMEELRREAAELKDIRSHWLTWRQEWEEKLARNEVQFLRAVADLENSYAHRSAGILQHFDDKVKQMEALGKIQHRDFEVALEKSALDLQKRFWEELEKTKLHYEQIIYAELRALRQRPHNFDWLHFSQKFRGQPETLRDHFRRYAKHFAGCRRVLDIGCGRGEFLEVLAEAGVAGEGIDLNPGNIALLKERGLAGQAGDVFEFLAAQGPGAFDGIFCAQVIEHLSPGQVWKLVQLCGSAITKGGVIVFETPNPESLAIFATHFFIDPSHTRPVPPPLLCFYLEEVGFGRIEVERFAAAQEFFPALAELPAGVREAFFGGLDYCCIARKLS